MGKTKGVRITADMSQAALDERLQTVLGFFAQVPSGADSLDFAQKRGIRFCFDSQLSSYGSYHMDKRLVVLQPNLSDVDLAVVLFHELRHARQFARGDIIAEAYANITARVFKDGIRDPEAVAAILEKDYMPYARLVELDAFGAQTVFLRDMIAHHPAGRAIENLMRHQSDWAHSSIAYMDQMSREELMSDAHVYGAGMMLLLESDGTRDLYDDQYIGTLRYHVHGADRAWASAMHRKDIHTYTGDAAFDVFQKRVEDPSGLLDKVQASPHIEAMKGALSYGIGNAEMKAQLHVLAGDMCIAAQKWDAAQAYGARAMRSTPPRP